MDKMEEKNMGGMGKVCKCPHHMVVPWLVILVGLDFLLGACNVFTAWFVAVTWPILVIIGGIVMLCSQRCGCCSK